MSQSHLSQEDYERRKNIAIQLKNLGVNPYPARSYKDDISKILENNKDEICFLEDIIEEQQEYSVCGRVMLIRCFGKNTFMTIKDDWQTLQVLAQKNTSKIYSLNENALYSHNVIIDKYIDIGDFISCKGPVFKTKKHEITILAKEIKFLCKALLPLPDKAHGLKDENILKRKRWLDLISNHKSEIPFIQRSKIIKLIRDFMHENDFIEVETPVLQSVYGGANARPFVTHINDLSKDLFLRIALEIPLKELLVGGFNKIFEIGKVFRNESIDRTHNPEFTSLEAYAAYFDYKSIMSFIENLLYHVVINIFDTPYINTIHPKTMEPITLDFTTPWSVIDLIDEVNKTLGINCNSANKYELYDALKLQLPEFDKDINTLTKGNIILDIFECLCEQNIVNPTHVINYPIESTPLCKVNLDKTDCEDVIIIERFESYICGVEVCNAYSELNDPILQRELLEISASKNKGSHDYNPIDPLFLESIDQGMPPAGGFGIGIDRIVMLLTGSKNISDILLFPMMK